MAVCCKGGLNGELSLQEVEQLKLLQYTDLQRERICNNPIKGLYNFAMPFLPGLDEANLAHFQLESLAAATKVFHLDINNWQS